LLLAVGYQGYWILFIAAFAATIYMLFGYETRYERSKAEIEREKKEDEQDAQPILKFSDQDQDKDQVL